MNNYFLTDPVKVYIYDPISAKHTDSYVFLGDVPRAIVNACTHPSKESSKLLRTHYGGDFAAKLGMVPPTMGVLAPSRIQITPGRQVTGGDHTDEIDIADIEALLGEPPDASKAREPTPQAAHARTHPETHPGKSHKHGPEYITDVHIFPEDRISEVKEKVFLVTGIPVYRQHLFYFRHSRVETSYRIYADGSYPVDIRNVARSRDSIHGIPIDKVLYETRNNIRVDALDTFLIMSEIEPAGHSLFIVDLDQFTRAKYTQLTEVANDAYQFNMFYYGFLIKYWPQLTQECAHDYIFNERELQHKYPELAKNHVVLAGIYRAEKEILVTNYRHAARAAAFAEATRVTIAITQLTAVITGRQLALNIRNLFDKLRVSKCIPEIRAYVLYNNKRYLLRKQSHSRRAVPFPSGSLMKNGIILAISLRKLDAASAADGTGTYPNEHPAAREEQRYLFLNIWDNGKYYVRATWNEEDELGFHETLKIIKKFTDPILTSINQSGRIVFVTGSALPLVEFRNINYQDLTICMFWKRVMLGNTFRVIKSLLEIYMRGRVIGPRHVSQSDRHEFLFRKGMHEFDTGAIEKIISIGSGLFVTNQYLHLSNSAVKQKWDQNFDGRVVRMYHRTTDIRFEVIGIREHEFEIFYHYILGFIYSSTHNELVKKSFATTQSYEDVKKLRKLREQDPELFNLKKYGSKKVYSIVCQNQRQPLIYTADELQMMSREEIARLTQYWNFTLSKPAYYGCPNRKYPHLNFMVGVHPKHYCLPCCNKKLQLDVDRKRTRVNAICRDKHTYTGHELSVGSRHIMNYGKSVEIGRLSKLPHSALKSLLFSTLNPNEGYYLAGVAQSLPGLNHAGLIFAIADAISDSNALHPCDSDDSGDSDDIGDSDDSSDDGSETTTRGGRGGTGSGSNAFALMNRMTTYLRSNPSTFYVLLNGRLCENFRDAAAVADAMDQLVAEPAYPTGGSDDTCGRGTVFDKWSELFVEIAHSLGITVITFIDDDGSGVMDLYVPNIIHEAEIARTQADDGGLGPRPFYDGGLGPRPFYDGGRSSTFGLRPHLTDEEVYVLVVRRQNNYYPIYLIDLAMFFKTSQIIAKTYPFGSGAVGLIRDMIVHADQSKDFAAGKQIDLQVIRAFTARAPRPLAEISEQSDHLATADQGSSFDPHHLATADRRSSFDPHHQPRQYRLTRKYINKQNMCYAVLLTVGANAASESFNQEISGPDSGHETGLVYVPIDYSPNAADGTEITFDAFDRDEYVVDFNNVLGFIEDMNAHIAGSYFLGGELYTYKLLKIESYVVSKQATEPSRGPFDATNTANADSATRFGPDVGAGIAIVVNGAYYYFTTGSQSALADGPEHRSIPVITRYDYTQVNRQILARAKPVEDPRNQRIGLSLYENYVYQLFLLEFVYYLSNERDEVIRGELEQFIQSLNRKNTQETRGALRTILKSYPADYLMIQKSITEFHHGTITKPELLASLAATPYEFDRKTMISLAHMEAGAITAKLRTIADKFTVQKDVDSTISFPNVYMPCEESPAQTGYCDHGKLILNRPLDEFVELLVGDITNPLKAKHLLGGIWMDVVRSYLDFVRVPGEIITIYRLTD
jgi:hypothetical protein